MTHDRRQRTAGDVDDVRTASPAARGTVPTDGRLLRGARTRGIVLRAAVDVASLNGLEGLSFGRLATTTGLSKAGIQTLFPSKEALQLATAAYARDRFAEAVTGPAAAAPHGIARVRALVERWRIYARTPLFEGGCFWTATLPEFDSRPGPVRDLLFTHQAEWLSVLEHEIGRAVTTGELAGRDPALLAFQIDAVLRSMNVALRHGDDGSVDTADRLLEAMLAPR